MRIKQRPEDFSVKESYRYDEVESGRYRVYMMDKQKLSTFDALIRLREKFGLKPGAISYCGLKDKQGRTEQLIAVDGKDIDLQEPDLRLKFLGHTDRPLSAANTTSNRFSVTVRAVRPEELNQLNLSVAEVNRLGVVNYFDSQRFGSLKHGQGFIAKDLIRGDYEAALKNYLARPSPLDRSDDAKVKGFWQANWNAWDARCPWPANKKYFRVLNSLREDPKDYLKAFLQIDSDYRAMLLFTFQSYLWNEGVRRLLQLVLPREHLFPMPYQAGTLLHHKDADPEVLGWLRGLTFPLLAPDSTFKDEKIREAAEWALGKEHLTLKDLQIPESRRLLFFKHEERPLLVYPHKLVLGRTQPDEMNKPLMKLNVAFTLTPGSYATLVIKRLFHFSYRDDTPDEIRATQAHVEQQKLERPGQLANRKRPEVDEREDLDDDEDDDELELEAPPSRGNGHQTPNRTDFRQSGPQGRAGFKPGPAQPRSGAPARPAAKADSAEAPAKKGRWIGKDGLRRQRVRANSPAAPPESGADRPARAPRPLKGGNPAPQVRKSSKPYKK
ncbi:MAG: truD [Myxococcaceae bacterium]|nr:truD [Myxococcaceae bacterium]